MSALVPVAAVAALALLATSKRASAAAPSKRPKASSREMDAARKAAALARAKERDVKREVRRVVDESRDIIKGKRDGYSKPPSNVVPLVPAKPAKRPAAMPKRSTTPMQHITVDAAQAILRRLGAPIERDGDFGPKTKRAWAHAARTHKLVDAFERVDGKTARVAVATVKGLSRIAKRAPASPAAPAAPAPSAPPPTQPSAPTPTGPQPPEGFDRQKATNAAPDVARHIALRKYDYSRQVLRAWQRLAGIAQDGIYGRGSAAALRHYVGAKAPKALFDKGTDHYPWSEA